MDVFSRFSEVQEAVLFGSRAKGNNRQGSDIDIAVKGTVSKDVLSALLVAFDETVLPYFVDIVVYDHIKNIALKEHIDRVGICIYSAFESICHHSLHKARYLMIKEGIVHEDDLWSFKLACMAQSMYVVDETTYYFSMQPDSIMRAPSMRYLECRVHRIIVSGLINNIHTLSHTCQLE